MIPTLAVSLLAVSAFGLALWWLDIAAVARVAVERSTSGIGAMLDPQLDDDAKEAALRAAGLKLLASAGQLAWRFTLILAAAAAPILLADALGLASIGAVLALMLRVDYIVIVSLVCVALVWLIGRMRPRARSAAPVLDHSHYSGTDRFFHYLAFARPGVLKSASALEDRLMPGIASEQGAPPVFVTSLARAGTTALLNALAELPDIATHTYRDMPFLTAPVLWDRLTGGEKRAVERRERAHGDGLEIALDSPEAFEEVVWKMFWPEKFTGPMIPLWTERDRRPEAERFAARHMAKIVGARRRERLRAGMRAGAGEDDLPRLYCSKNNGNIARLDYLREAFPSCRIVIPLRRPESHAASLLRQHRNFAQLQREDDFVRRYMRDIGHFEFGLIHKPVAFPGFDPGAYERDSPDYWLQYWICTYRQILATPGEILFVTQDELRARPQATMEALCRSLGIEPGSADFTRHFRPGSDSAPRDVHAPALMAEADRIYDTLAARSLVHRGEQRATA